MFPRALFGDNDFVVPLTLREHYVAHKLLFHICLKRYGKHKNTTKMCAAYHMMSQRCSRHYETAKRHFIEHHHTKTKEGRAAISKRNSGKGNGMYGKAASNKGVPHTDSAKQKNREKHNKTYELYFTDGTSRVIVGAKQFAAEHGYNHGHLIQVVRGNRKRHKDIIGGRKID